MVYHVQAVPMTAITRLLPIMISSPPNQLNGGLKTHDEHLRLVFPSYGVICDISRP